MKKNIIIVVSSMNMGGAQRVVSILCNYWSKKGYIITLIATNSQDNESYFQLNKGIDLKHLSNIKFFSNFKLLNRIWKLIKLRKLMKDLNPDVVISFLTSINVATTLAIIGFKFPLILCERTWTPFSSINKSFFWIYKIFLKKAKKIIVQTKDSEIWMSKNFPTAYVEVIPNPVEYPLHLDKSKSIHPDSLILPNKKIILASGRLHKYKQFDLLLKAFSSIQHQYREWDLVILGDGEERDKLNQSIIDLEIKERVFLPGSVGNISTWYERADLFVLCSKLEGFPNVLLESMSYGLPCISFDINTGPRDMIQNGVNGILVNPMEKELGIKKALIKMINNDELRKVFSHRSIILKDKYSIKNVMQIWDKVLNF